MRIVAHAASERKALASEFWLFLCLVYFVCVQRWYLQALFFFFTRQFKVPVGSWRDVCADSNENPFFFFF